MNKETRAGVLDFVVGTLAPVAPIAIRPVWLGVLVFAILFAVFIRQDLIRWWQKRAK